MARPTRPGANDPPDGAAADGRMVDILQGEKAPRQRLRESLRDEGTRASDDLLGRLNALEFVDTLVGEVTEMPERLGDYRITGLLGRGGMGTVYEAFQETLEREVALKVLSPTFSADVTMRERFRTEARATASLHHENIVPIYDFGESGGVLFFAMERVAGVSLDKHVSAARRHGKAAMEPREAAARFAGVAEALGHAHRRGILHRDVKPGNLLVGPDGTVALADFGLSKTIGEVSRALTVGGAFLGTLSYAPPEQAKGQQPTPATDLYALGVTIFEVVTGELPLWGSSTEAMLDAVLHGTPKRLREVLPKAPRDLQAVLDKLLQKDPADRYADGEKLARDLRRIAEGEPVKIRRQPVWQRAWRRAKRNPELSLALVAVTVLTAVTLALIIVASNQHRSTVAARYDGHLREAMRAWRHSGPPNGPGDLLASLIGTTIDVESRGDQVLRRLDLAERANSDRPEAPALRLAYIDDPLPQVSLFLREGKGYPARQLLDSAIELTRPGFDEGDDPSLIVLYRLYVARAVASLSASVAGIDDAKMDLSAASFIRPKAFFPKLLLVFVDWAARPQATDLQSRVALLVDQPEAPAGAARSAGALLCAFSGLGRPEGCNLMDVTMPYTERVAIHAAGIEMLGEEASMVAGGTRWWSGLERALADAAVDTMGVLSDAVARGPSVARGRDILLSSVAPNAPLRSWEFVFGFLANPHTPSPATSVADAGDMSQQVRGWIDLLRLDPPFALVSTIMAPRIHALIDRHPDAPRVAELGGLLASRTNSDTLLEVAEEWYRAEPGHPGALLCRFQALVHRGQVLEASVCGAELLQRVVDRGPALAEIVRILRVAEQGGDERAASRWGELRQSFERQGGAGR